MYQSTMLERIAEAISVGLGQHGKFTGKHLVAARNALEAMKEPTEEMKKDCGTPRMKICIEEYTSMIEAALKE